MSFHIQSCPPVLFGVLNKHGTKYRAKANPFVALQAASSLFEQTHENGGSPEPNRQISGSSMALTSKQIPNHLLSQPNTIGIIGGVSAFSTLIFLEKLVRWSSKELGGCPPFVVCSDPALYTDIHFLGSFHSLKNKLSKIDLNSCLIIDNLQLKRAFLEQSGARCVVMPCHLSHVWYSEISDGCSLPFLHVAECVSRELKEENLKPLEVGSKVRIGILATDTTLMSGYYQNVLQSQGFEVVLPDKATMEHILIPAIGALNRRDFKGAQNLLKIAIQLLLVRAVNTVILASDEMQGLLPHDDPLLKRCRDPLDCLARSAIKWAQTREAEDKKA